MQVAHGAVPKREAVQGAKHPTYGPAHIRDDGITSIYVSGDIPVHPDLKNLKFFIQQNLFLTEASEYAHVFLPVPVFPEMSGHLLTLDRKLKELNQIIQPEKGVKQLHEIINKITKTFTVSLRNLNKFLSFIGKFSPYSSNN